MRSRSLWLLLGSIALTATVGITAYATRDARAPATPKPPMAVPDRPAHGPDYVAIGDSFTAGGAFGQLQAGGKCFRAHDDYPSQVARSTGLSLTDVSCGGASTHDVLHGDDGTTAQVDAVTPKTKLVTVSVGGNDHAIYATTFVNCLRYAKSTKVGAPCKASFGGALARQLPDVQRSVTAVLQQVQARAPDARIMVVTYLRLLPDHKPCSELPYPTGDVAWVIQVERKLSAAMRHAAVSRGTEVVDMHELSAGHDVCSTDPWVNGLRPKNGEGWFLHPNPEGATAIARAVTAAWRQGPPARH